MGERIDWRVFERQLRLRALVRRSGGRTAAHDPLASLRARGATQRLLSGPDAANCRDLREETRVILARLTPHEQEVLRMRFGIDAAPRHCVEEIARHYALESGYVREMEAQALRKLRHPGGRPLKSVGRR